MNNPSKSNGDEAIIAKFPIPVYIVGLSEEYRGHELENQLRNVESVVHRFHAFDARQLGSEDLSELVDQNAARFLQHRDLTPGEIGCAISHREALREVARADHNWAVILEDDARLNPVWITLHSILEELDCTKPRIILLWAQSDYTVLRASSHVRIQSERENVTVSRTFTPPPSAAAYVVNRAAAQLASCRSGNRIETVADWPPKWAYDVEFFVAYPWLASPAPDAKSTLQPARSHFESHDQESRIKRLTRHLESALCIRYLRRPAAYPGFRQFWMHEVTRPIQLARARRWGKRLDGNGPWIV